MINHKNYEIWFLDFAEGNLSERQVELLMDFLDKNDDLKAEFDAMEMIQLPLDDAFVFAEKSKLKRPLTADISLTNDDKLLIGELEGDLNAQEMAQLQGRLGEQPELAHAKSIYEKSQLTPDLTVKYPNKKELKRKHRRVIPLRLMLQIAAAVLLLVVMIFALRKGVDTEAVEMPIVETPSQVLPIKPIQEEQKDQPITADKVEVVEVPKAIIEQAIIPLPRKRKKSPKLPDMQVVPQNKSLEAIVNKEPKVRKRQVPQMQSPPKPQLEPELPDPKPVLASNKTQDQPKATFVNQPVSSNKRLIALNKPKDFLMNVVDKGIKKIVKKEDVKERLSVPEAIVSTVGAITKTETSYNKEQTKDSKRMSVSIGRFKFKRVKHRSR